MNRSVTKILQLRAIFRKKMIRGVNMDRVAKDHGKGEGEGAGGGWR
jgi:hypothetical protein